MTVIPLPVRRGDPTTSREAAAIAVTRRPRVRDAVHMVIVEEGPLTHDELIASYRQRSASIVGWPMASESSIRTRCSELVRDGHVVRDEHDGASRMGNRALLWRAITVQGTRTNVQNGGTE